MRPEKLPLKLIYVYFSRFGEIYIMHNSAALFLRRQSFKKIAI